MPWRRPLRVGEELAGVKFRVAEELEERSVEFVLAASGGNGEVPEVVTGVGSQNSVLSLNHSLNAAWWSEAGRATTLRFVFRFILALLAAVRVFFRSRQDTALEMLALRQQVVIIKAETAEESMANYKNGFNPAS